MTKEELIKEAWGGINENINENGWYYFGYCVNGWGDVKDWLKENNLISDKSYYNMTYDELYNGDLFNVEIRPKSLKDIETNNGWSVIHSIHDKEIEKGQYWIMHPNGFIEVAYYDGTMECYKFWKLNFTHYQPIVKPLKPLY